MNWNVYYSGGMYYCTADNVLIAISKFLTDIKDVRLRDITKIESKIN